MCGWSENVFGFICFSCPIQTEDTIKYNLSCPACWNVSDDFQYVFSFGLTLIVLAFMVVNVQLLWYGNSGSCNGWRDYELRVWYYTLHARTMMKDLSIIISVVMTALWPCILMLNVSLFTMHVIFLVTFIRGCCLRYCAATNTPPRVVFYFGHWTMWLTQCVYRRCLA